MIDINDESLKDEVREIIAKVVRIDKTSITDNASLRKDLWIDSLQAIQIIALIEDRFGIMIDEVEILNVDTVIDVIDLIREYSEDGSK